MSSPYYVKMGIGSMKESMEMEDTLQERHNMIKVQDIKELAMCLDIRVVHPTDPNRKGTLITAKGITTTDRVPSAELIAEIVASAVAEIRNFSNAYAQYAVYAFSV